MKVAAQKQYGIASFSPEEVAAILDDWNKTFGKSISGMNGKRGIKITMMFEAEENR